VVVLKNVARAVGDPDGVGVRVGELGCPDLVDAAILDQEVVANHAIDASARMVDVAPPDGPVVHVLPQIDLGLVAIPQVTVFEDDVMRRRHLANGAQVRIREDLGIGEPAIGEHDIAAPSQIEPESFVRAVQPRSRLAPIGHLDIGRVHEPGLVLTRRVVHRSEVPLPCRGRRPFQPQITTAQGFDGHAVAKVLCAVYPVVIGSRPVHFGPLVPEESTQCARGIRVVHRDGDGILRREA